MLHRGTFFDHAIYFLWQASRLASRWIGDRIKQHYLLLLFFILLPVMFSRINGNSRGVIWSDAEGYYQYLPGLFIIKDFHKLPNGSVWPYYNDKGEYVDKYTCGLAIFELPFFLAGYLLSPIAGYDRMDYFNPVYCKAIAVCGFFITFLGLFFLRKILLRIVSPLVSALVIISVFFGTNLFHYATKEMGAVHVYGFCLFAFLIYLLPFYLKNPDWKRSLLIGAVLGWIILIRPTNILVALLLLLYDVYSLDQFKQRLQFYVRHLTSIVWMMMAAFVFFIPQLLYWKEMTGQWIYYSYTTEGFTYWSQPKIAAVLLDVQNGWLLYSPICLFMLIGIVYGLRNKNYQAPVVLIIVSLATYLFASWWAWWFGGAFGHRSYVEYYALLAIPMAGLYQWVSTRRNCGLKCAFNAIVILLIVFSVRLSYLYTSIGGPWDGADWRWNWDKYAWILSHLI